MTRTTSSSSSPLEISDLLDPLAGSIRETGVWRVVGINLAKAVMWSKVVLHLLDACALP